MLCGVTYVRTLKTNTQFALIEWRVEKWLPRAGGWGEVGTRAQTLSYEINKVWDLTHSTVTG